jgi:hypothetical protein
MIVYIVLSSRNCSLLILELRQNFTYGCSRKCVFEGNEWHGDILWCVLESNDLCISVGRMWHRYIQNAKSGLPRWGLLLSDRLMIYINFLISENMSFRWGREGEEKRSSIEGMKKEKYMGETDNIMYNVCKYQCRNTVPCFKQVLHAQDF